MTVATRPLLLALAFLSAICSLNRCTAAPSFVWMESESGYTITPPAIVPVVDDDGRPDLLSGGKWLKIDLSADDVASKVSADGIVITYPVTISSPGVYQIWNRVGFEAVRSSFEWRVDDGPWATVSSTDGTTNLDELQTWNPIGWLDMGGITLSTGAHTLSIRLMKQIDGSGKVERILYASDAICFYPGVFRPNDQYRPEDSTYQTNQDKAAATTQFDVSDQSTTADAAAQRPVPLSGIWQVARDDEDTVVDPSGAIKGAPDVGALYWKSMCVPGDIDKQLPQWSYSHRYWLQTQLQIPSELTGRSFYVHFPSTSMVATVFVNGIFCGFSNTPFAAWDCDITRAVKPGGINILTVGIKDWFYALPDNGAVEGGHIQYIPADWVTKFGPANFTFPVWNHTVTGIIQTPTVVVAGPVYTSDVFVKPLVSSGTLGIDITLQNSSTATQTVTVTNSVIPFAGGSAVKTFVPLHATINAGSTSVLSVAEAFPGAKLWWPDAPCQYNLSTAILVNEKAIDSRTTKFGYREWTWSHGQFTLNGVPWHGRADLVDFGRADDETTAIWRKHGQNMARMWGEDNFSGLSPDNALDYYDSHGVVIRRTGIFDGEAARYKLVEGDHVNQELFSNWKNQILAWAKGERNHPSIFIWSIENEIAYINAKVYGISNIVDPAERDVAEALEQLDPTRPVMTDGGNALLDESMPVYGCHYIEPSFETLPEGAYDLGLFTHSQIWPITQSKPIILGESFYANGDKPADLATVGGDTVSTGKAEERPAIGLAAKIYSEGLRWNRASFHFWIGGESDAYYNSWQPVAALCRQWDWTFGAGQSVDRTIKIYNDTHDSSPILFRWTADYGATANGSSAWCHVQPGESATTDVHLIMPAAAIRLNCAFTLRLYRNNKLVFTNNYPFSVLPKPRLMAHPALDLIAVYDPSGAVQHFLAMNKIVSSSVVSLANVDASLANAKVLIIGRNALASLDSTSGILTAYAKTGKSVIVLEQTNLLKLDSPPSTVDTTTDNGDIGFIQDHDSPVFSGLTQADFFTWGPDGELYTNAYKQSASAGRSLIECGLDLADSALTEFTPGAGLMLISQLDIGSKLSSNPVAQRLLMNMIDYGLGYKLISRATVVDAGSNKNLLTALDAIHLRYAQSNDPLSSIGHPGDIAIIDASPTNLAALASNKSLINQFTAGGGWIIFNNLTPDGISQYNQIVGVDHLIRPFRQEKVEFPAERNPLTVGLPPSDIVMGNGKDIFNWEAGQYPDSDEFSYVVDTDDIAPFCTSSFFGWNLITNGFTMADGYWPLIINFPAPTDGKPYDIPITLPKSEIITSFTYVGDNNYWPQTSLNLQLGSNLNLPFTYDPGDITQPAQLQTYAINEPAAISSLHLQIVGWQKMPNVVPNIGIDNVYISIKRVPDFYQRVRPMLNVGGLVEYPRGSGGFILCNIKFKDTGSEANPENASKKQAIIAVILKNLQAQFTD